MQVNSRGLKATALEQDMSHCPILPLQGDPLSRSRVAGAIPGLVLVNITVSILPQTFRPGAA
jgi:hypothetical protein